MKRASFECLVEAAARANRSRIQHDSCGNDQSQQIKFRRTGLTRDRGAASDPATPVRAAGRACRADSGKPGASNRHPDVTQNPGSN